MIVRKTKVWSLLCVIAILIFYTFYNVAIPSFKLWRKFDDVQDEIEVQDVDKKMILYWDRPWGNVNNWPWEGWTFGDCRVTYDRSSISKATALVFHYSIIKPRDIPWKHLRFTNQSYVWWSAETPVSVSNELHMPMEAFTAFDGFFNQTMTYRHDADIFWGYNTRRNLLENLPRGQSVVDDIIKRKNNLAVWAVSNCGKTKGARNRMDFASRMVTTGISLTRLGACFDSAKNPVIGDDVLRTHKFYLSFENARNCRYYITEKFWDMALRNDIVPVVWGAPIDDVRAAAPYNSFIHADEFESPEALAQHLDYLDKDDAEYRKFFQWRESDVGEEEMVSMIKDKYPDIEPFRGTLDGDLICEKLIGKNSKGPKVVTSLYDSFFTANAQECLEKS